MNRTIITAVLWVASLGLVYFFASSGSKESADPTPEPTKVEVVKVKEAGEVVFVNRPSQLVSDNLGTMALADDALGDGPDAYRGMDAGISSDDMARTLPAALNSDDRISQNLIVAHMLSQLTAENAGEMLSAFENTKKNYHTDHHFRMFMFAWGQVDGRAATEYAFKQKDGRKVSWGGTSALAAWAEKDPASVFDYLNEQDDQGIAEKMHPGFIMGYARANIGEAQNYVAGMESGRLRGGAIDSLMREHQRLGDRGGMLEWASQTLTVSDDPNYIKAVLARTTDAAARDNGIELAQWIDRNVASEFVTPKMFEEAADEWAEKDPLAAAAWLERNLEDERVNQQVVGEFTDEWAKTDPTRAAAWVDKHLGTDYVTPKVTGRMAGEWAEKDPAGALEWVNTLPSDMQATSYAYVAQQWPRADLDSAVSWIESSGTGKDYDGARAGVAARLSGDDPARAIELASKITNVKTREDSIVRSAQSMVRKGDAEAVKAWLPVSGLSEEAQRRVFQQRGGRRG